MNVFSKLMRVAMVMAGALGGSSGVLAAGAAEKTMTQLVAQVKAVGAGQWVGWNEESPSALYYFREGEKPQSLGELPAAPSSMAVGAGRVLWVGSGYRALAPLNQLDQVKVSAFEGDWDTAVGNPHGFVMKDGARVAFSKDGETWQPVAHPDIDENTNIQGMAASADQFALLLEVNAGTAEEHSNYVYSIIAVSKDGLKWENAYFSEPNPGEPELTMLGYGNGRWMAFGVGSAYTSTDGREWESSAVGRDALPELRGAILHTGGGEWWAADWRDQFEYSPDGLDWSAKSQYLHQIKGGATIWAVGNEGMRNLGLDEQGKLRSRTLAVLLPAATLPPAAMVVAKPVKPATPVKAATLGNAELAKQWAQLDGQLHAQTTLVGFSRKLAELVNLFAQAEDAAIGQAVKGSALTFVLQRGDAACLAAFKPALNEKAYRDAGFVLEKGLEVKRAILKGKTLPAPSRGKRGKEAASPLNPEKLRLNLLAGTRGAAYDLSVAYHAGYSFQIDGDMSYLWNLVTQNLIPGTSDYASPEAVKKLLAAGSAITSANAVGSINLNRGEAGFTSRQWELIAQAAAGGVHDARRYLEARDAWRVDAAHMPTPVWPPPGTTNWTADEMAKYRALFDRHVAFSREVMAFRAALQPGSEPDLDQWRALLARHQTLLNDPEIGALYEAYVQSPVAMALIYDADTPITPAWAVHMKESKAGLATVAINPDLWNFRARMLRWSGQLEEARRDAAMAVLMLDLKAIQADQYFDLLAATTRTLKLELNLPAAVLAAPEQGIAPYNLSVSRRNAFLGKLDASDEEMAVKLFANFGSRLNAAWQLPEAAQRRQAESDLFKVHGSALKDFNYPTEAFGEWRKKVDAIWQSRNRDKARALADLETLIAEVAHPSFLTQRAMILQSMDRGEDAVEALENILTVWKSYEFAQTQLARLRDRAAQSENEKSLALYQDALGKLNHGDVKGGLVLLNEVSALPKPPVSALLVLAEVQMNQRQIAEADATLRRAFTLYPDDAQPVANLASLLIAQRKVNEARELIGGFLNRRADDANLQAILIMADVMDAMTSGQNAPAVVQEALGKLNNLKSAGRYQPQVFAVSAQLNMLMKNQQEAVAEMARMAGMKSYVPPEMWFQIGQLYLNLNMPIPAKEHFEKAAEHGVAQAKEMLKKL